MLNGLPREFPCPSFCGVRDLFLSTCLFNAVIWGALNTGIINEFPSNDTPTLSFLYGWHYAFGDTFCLILIDDTTAISFWRLSSASPWIRRPTSPFGDDL